MNTVNNIPAVASAETGADGIIITPVDAHIDARASIARVIVEAGFGLIEIRPLAVNLEDIFIELTRREQNPGDIPEEILYQFPPIEESEGDNAEETA